MSQEFGQSSRVATRVLLPGRRQSPAARSPSESCCPVAVTSMVAAAVMRTFVLATMLASASSFAPAPKTQLAMRRPPPTPPRVMPLVMITHSRLYYLGFPGFPSQASKDWEIAMVCLVPTPHGPACTSPPSTPAPLKPPPWRPTPPWSPSPLEPAPAMCAVTNATNSQLHRFRACAGEETARARAILARLHAHRLCVYRLCTRNGILTSYNPLHAPGASAVTRLDRMHFYARSGVPHVMH